MIKLKPIITPPKRIKDKIIYVRMENDHVMKLDKLQMKLDFKCRSQVIQYVLGEALKQIKV